MNLQIESPLWLLLPLLLPWLPVWGGHAGTGRLPGQWHAVLDTTMQRYLRRFSDGAARGSRPGLWLLLLVGLGVALAVVRIGDAPVTPERDLHGRVLLVDLGDPASARQSIFLARRLAMRADQIPTAIVVSGADAYDVVPLTGDAGPLTRYLDVLVPDMLPGAGHAPEAGVRRALAMFERAGTVARQIVLIGGQAPPSAPAAAVPEQQTLVIVAPATAADDWRSWAPRAQVLDAAAVDTLDEWLVAARDRAVRGLAHGGIDLTPWFIGLAMIAALALFCRRER